MMRRARIPISILILAFACGAALAEPVLDPGALAPGTSHVPSFDGADLEWPWALPFIGILLTIAVGPLLFPRVWHNHYGKIAFMWAALTVVPIAALYDIPTAAAAFAHAAIDEYLSFIVLLFALYVVAGGILLTGDLKGTPLVNTAILTLGALIASIVGTTGAAMILIRPLLLANATRLHNAHVVVFFIILVANVGGALSPLGDPPLFVGFLRGVDFFWTTKHLWQPTALLAGTLLVIFIVLDWWFYRQDRRITTVGEPPLPPHGLVVEGSINFALIGGIVAVILMSSLWRPGVSYEVYGTTLELQNVLRDGALIVMAIVSLILTPNQHREANGFTWEPIREVAILFAGIFACIIPVLAMLRAGPDGAFAWVPRLIDESPVPNEIAYFWLTGLLSAFLDNAPTYLVFFEMAGGRPNELMGPLAATLAAISMGAVYLGALTYIGNAPNLMVYAIAVERGIKMPSFFGYLMWAALILAPGLALVTWLYVWT
jgi:Na+/H+ antiporter NhaD/arsenite permease-like protein